MDVAGYVCAQLNGRADAIMDRALELRGLPAPGPSSWFADRALLVRTTVISPIKRRLAKAPALAEPVVVYEPGTSDIVHARRREFMSVHFGEEVDFVGRGQERVPAQGMGTWSRWYLLGVKAACLALIDFSERRYSWLGGLLLDVQSMSRALPGMSTVYCFNLFDKRPYLIATWLHAHTDVHVVMVFQNVPFYRNCRYLHLAVPAVLTSKVNLAEAEYYRSQGIFKASEIIYRSQEFPLDCPDDECEPAYDIGYYSSGEWARRDGLYIQDDLEDIASGVWSDNPYAEAADRIIAHLVTYAERASRTLKIYPHPYERRLYREHGIEPPWLRYVDGDRVVTEWEGENSRQAMLESRVAVSLQSSLIWERLDRGAETSYIYDFPEKDMNVAERAALGPYADNMFGSIDELTTRLDRAFSAG